MLELRDGTRTNSKMRVQSDINLHNQENKDISASQIKMVQ
jgi:hypothetical protein